MTYRSKTQPRCLNCNAPIAKQMRDVHVVARSEFEKGSWRGENCVVVETLDHYPTTITQCRALTPHRVTAVTQSIHRRIMRFRVWDRETWQDGEFCTNKCATAFGHAAARAGWRKPNGASPGPTEASRARPEASC